MVTGPLTGGVEAGQPGLLSARTLGGFVLRDQIGAGGFGDVYLAEQSGLGREAIVKVLREGDVNERRVQRFLREAKLASRFDHPYAAHIYDYGAEPDGTFWIAMELVRGASLRAVLEAQGPMPLERFVPLLDRICEVVQTAHEQGIVHRDIKPDNVMVISRAGRLLPKLLDFGIARAIGDDQALDGSGDDGDSPASTTTQRGTIVGSPPYMAPELWIDPAGAGPAVDQYAIAALAFEALTGRIAFTGKTTMEIARAHARSTVPALGDAFPTELDLVLRRATTRAASGRYGNVLELAQAFRAAAGVSTATTDLVQIDEAVRTAFLSRAPRPLADAVAAYDAAKNAHQAREALRGLAHVASWYVGILALACRTRVGSGGTADSPRAQDLLRDLRRHGLSPAGWISLARQLTLPFAKLPDAHPVPELVLLLHEGDVFAASLEGSLMESLGDASEAAATLAIARELPVITATLRALTFLHDYQLVVPRGDKGESWMGTRSGQRRTVQLQRSLPDGRPTIVDAAGAPLLALWPLVQAHVAVPGHAEHLFMLAGPKGAAARLVATQQAFEHRDTELWDWFGTQLFASEDRAAVAPDDASPYRGLAAYASTDSELFFGREREIEQLVNRLVLEPFVAVVGPSGVGKSSFVHAGVLPSLADWRAVTARPGRAPLRNLGAQLDVPELDALTDATIDAMVRRLRDENPKGLVVIVDQFEELFTLGCPDDERDRFTRLLLAIGRDSETRLRVIITLRDDFLIRAQQLRGFDLMLARGLHLLGPMHADALERIIVEPARRVGYEFDDPTLPARMVGEAASTPAAVALISFAASRLWELRDRHFKQLPRKAYDAIGGVGGALARHADETVESLSAAERSLLRKAFRHLVTFEGTRAVLEREELIQLLGGGAEAQRLVERLVASRLVVSSENEHGASVVEIIHEALVSAWPRLAEWLHEDVEGSRFHQQLRAAAKQWDDRKRARGLLWRGDALTEYQLWRKRRTENLTPLEEAFGAASNHEAARGLRIRRTIIAFALIATSIFFVALWLANRAARRSEHVATGLLVASTVDRGRLLTLQGEKLKALDPLVTAYQMGETGPAIRFMLEEALRTTRPLIRKLSAQAGKIRAVVFSQDGRRVATASEDATIVITDVASGDTLATFRQDGGVVELGVSPDGTMLASAGHDHQVHLWSMAELRELGVIDLHAVDESTIRDVVFSPDGQRLLVAGHQTLTLCSVPDRVVVGRFAGEFHDVDATFCASGECVVTWDRKGAVAWWDARTLAKRAHRDVAANVQVATASPTGDRVAYTTESGELILIRDDGTELGRHTAHDGKTINAISFSPDGRTLATGGDDNAAWLWDAATATPLAELSGHRGGVTAVRFSPDASQLATGSADGGVRLWAIPSGMMIGALSGHTNLVDAAAFSQDGLRLATASWDHQAIVWDIRSARQFRAVEAEREGVVAVGRDRVALGASDGSLDVHDLDPRHPSCHAAAETPMVQVVWGLDGGLFATAGEHDRAARVWTADTCTLIATLPANDAVSGLAFGPSRKVVVGASDGSWSIWDLSGPPSRTPLDPVGAPIIKVGFAPDGKRAYAASANPASAVVVQDLGPDSRRVVLKADRQPMLDVAFDPRRNRVLAAGADHRLWVWNDVTGALITSADALGELVSLQLSPDGAFVVGVGGVSPDVWDAETLKRLGVLEGHTSLVSTGVFLADGLFVTASSDETARVWDLATLHPLEVLPNAVLAFGSFDGAYVVFRDVKGTVIWNPRSPTPDPAELRARAMHLK